MPTINVRLFAALRERIGATEVTLELPEGATTAQLRQALGARYPDVAPMLSRVVCAVDEEYVPGEHVLREGTRVALIPPVSGGR